MKKLRNLLFACLLAMTMALMVHAPAQAATNGMSYSYTDNSITINWPQPTFSSSSYYSYAVTSYSIYDSTTKTYLATNLSPSTHSWTKTGLSKGYISNWYVYYYYSRTYLDDGSVYNSSYPDSLGNIHVNTTPATLSTKNFGIEYLSNTSTGSAKVEFAAVRPSYDFYTKLELYKGKKKVKTMYFSTYSDYVTVSKNAVYKYRVCLYYTNSDTQKTCYGKWSSFKYFENPKGIYSYSYGKRGCKLTLYKVSGVKSYSIYVSTKYNSGFKKTSTVTVTQKRKTVSLKKIGKSSMKKGKYYYVRIIPNIKVGSKTVQSPTFGTYSFYNSK